MFRFEDFYIFNRLKNQFSEYLLCIWDLISIFLRFQCKWDQIKELISALNNKDFDFRYEPKGSQAAKSREAAAPKKPAIPGAVFAADAEKPKKSESKKTSEKQVDSLTNRVSEIKISTKITPEQIEEDARQKKIRKLKKTLREIEQIEEKLNAKQPVEKEQADKIKKKQSILDELEELGEPLD